MNKPTDRISTLLVVMLIMFAIPTCAGRGAVTESTGTDTASSGTNSGSPGLDTTPPTIPASLTVNPVNSSALNLSWLLSTDNVTNSSAMSYEICSSSTPGGCDTFTVSTAVTNGTVTYSATGLQPSTTYYFRLRARDSAGNVSSSTLESSATTQTIGSVSAPTASPIGGVYGSSQIVTLTSATVGAVVCYTTNGTTPACNASGGCAAGTAGTSATISANTWLRAVGCKAAFTSSGVPGWNYTIDVTGPAAPTFFDAGLQTLDSYYIDWSDATDNLTSSANLTYQICRSTTAGACAASWNTTYTTSAGVTNYTMTAFSNGTTYYFQVRAVDQVGNTGTPTVEISLTTRVPITAQWARMNSSGLDKAFFTAVATDSSGNIYAAGEQAGSVEFTYGTGVSATGTGAPGYKCATLVKYNSAGVAQWVRVINSSNAFSGSGVFRVAIDNSGNILVAGVASSNYTYAFGSGVNLNPAAQYSSNAFLAKFASNGTALWATGAAVSSDITYFRGLAVDSSNDIFVVGLQYGNSTVDYGSGVTITAPSGAPSTAILLKYSASGVPLWGRGVASASDHTSFQDISFRPDGTLIAVGSANGTGVTTYGAGVSVTGKSTSYNPVIVKFDGAGSPIWAKTTISGTDGAYYSRLAVESSGNIYVTGSKEGSALMNFGNGITMTNQNSSRNAILLKFDSTGNALWAQTGSTTTATTYFSGVAIEASGNVIVSGGQWSNANIHFGNSVSLRGGSTYGNPSIIRYSPTGNPLYGRTTIADSNNAYFDGLALDPSGNIFAVGGISGTISLGNSVYAWGPWVGDYSPVLVKYQ